jgi:N-carbamoyl-L-amino-acid hydrolase
MNIRVQSKRVMQELAELAIFSSAPSPAVTRVVFTEPDLQARAWLKGLCTKAGLVIREDAIGNTFARWNGTEPALPAVGTGSHIDAIPNAGRFDGTVGVLGGLEAIRALQESGFQPRRSIELVLFTSEEPTRFGVGCLGSRLLSGTLSADAADVLVDQDGTTLAQARQNAGFTGGLETVRLSRNHYCAFLELHIEQGPILERERIGLGVVTHIAAPASLCIHIEGEGGHAGAVLMPQRRDALVAAAELMLAIEAAALETACIDTVATTGICDVFPGAVNSIPSHVELGVDIRDTDLRRRDSVLDEVNRASKRIGAKRNVTISTAIVNADPPAACDAGVVSALIQSCEEEALSYLRMISRAYHDSLFMSRICPVAMLFIPCRNGISHRPDEYASEQDITNGIRVLAGTLAQLPALERD